MLAIIGGTGLYDLAGLQIESKTADATPFGQPSGAIVHGRIPVFSPQGKFDQGTYEYYLQRENITPTVFETEQREYLLRKKLENLIEDSVDVSDAELAEAYAASNPKAKAGD